MLFNLQAEFGENVRRQDLLNWKLYCSQIYSSQLEKASKSKTASEDERLNQCYGCENFSW